MKKIKNDNEYVFVYVNLAERLEIEVVHEPEAPRATEEGNCVVQKARITVCNAKHNGIWLGRAVRLINGIYIYI